MARPGRTVAVLAPFGKRVDGAAEIFCGLGRCGVQGSREVAEKVAHFVVGVSCSAGAGHGAEPGLLIRRRHFGLKHGGEPALEAGRMHALVEAAGRTRIGGALRQESPAALSWRSRALLRIGGRSWYRPKSQPHVRSAL